MDLIDFQAGKARLPSLRAIQAEKRRRSLAEFTKYYWKVLEGDLPLEWNWHHDRICEALEQVTAREIKVLVICVPPGTLKSTIVSVMWSAWKWLPGNHPETKSIYLSGNANVSIRDSLKTRNILESPEYLEDKQILSDVNQERNWSFVEDQNQKALYKTTEHGSRYSNAIGGKLTGDRGDEIVIDDPVDVDEVIKGSSDRIAERMQNVIEYYDQKLYSRRNDLRSDPIVIIMQRLHFCLLPDTKVSTPYGTCEARKIGPGSLVMTSDGEQAVVASAQREYEGAAYGIRTAGSPDIAWFTEEHRILSAEGWRVASSIKAGDWLVHYLPLESRVTSIEKMKEQWPTLRRNGPPTKQSQLTAKRKKVPEDELRSMVAAGWSDKKIAKHFGYSSRLTIGYYRSAYGISKDTSTVIPADVMENPKFWRFVGYWLAEGDLMSCRAEKYAFTRLTFGKHEEDTYAEDACIVLRGIGLTPTKKTNKSICSVFVSGRQLAHFLSIFGDRADNKTLPSWVVMLPKELVSQMLIGYWRGDGSGEKTKTIRFSSVSRGLLQGVRRILLRFRAASKLYKGEASKKPIFKEGPYAGKKYNCKDPYELRVNKHFVPWIADEGGDVTVSRSFRFTPDAMHVKVKEVHSKEYKGIVYDIETPAHDFLCDLITAHNCDLAGTVIDRAEKGTKVLCFPLEFDPEIACPEDMRTVQGDILDPVRFTPEVVAEAREKLGRQFAAQYNQRPVPTEGGMFQADWFKRQYPWNGAGWRANTHIRPLLRRIITVDCANKAKETSDFTVFGHWGQDEQGDVWLLGLVRKKLDFPGLLKTATLLARADMPDVFFIEDAGNGTALIPVMKETFRGDLMILSAVPKGEKEMRASNTTDWWEAGRIWIPSDDCPWVASFIEEHLRFGHTRYDDQVDMTAWALDYFNKHKSNFKYNVIAAGILYQGDNGYVIDKEGQKRLTHSMDLVQEGVYSPDADQGELLWRSLGFRRC